MRLSIVVPVYNVEEFILDCLNSIYTNQLKDFEVICVDDCGNDTSISIIQEFVKKNKIDNLKIIKHKKNCGLSASRNTGLKRAHGKYICYLDSDDMLNTDGLAFILEKAINNNLDIAEGNYSEFFETNQNISVKDSLKHIIKEDYIYTGEEFFEIASRDFTPMVWRRIYRREFLIENDLYFYEGLKFEDEEFSPRVILKAKRIMHFNNDIYLYRRRDNSITTSMTKNNDWVNHYLTIINSLTDFSNSLSKENKKSLNNRIGQIALSLYKNPLTYGCSEDNLKKIIEIVKEKKIYNIPKKSSNLFVKIQGFLMKYPRVFFLLYKVGKKCS